MEPITRKEMYLATLTGDYAGELPEPVTREEHYLSKLCEGGLGTPSWGNVQSMVRSGLAPAVFPVGYELTVPDAVTGRELIFVVRAHDHHKASDERLTHTMTLELKTLYSGADGGWQAMQFDAAEAFYYAKEELPPGVYNFTWDHETGNMVNGTYQFTLTKGVPAGGQIVLGTNSSNRAITDCKVSTYASVGAVEAIESGVSVTEGSDGTSLGTMSDYGATDEGLNCCQRVMDGSNNYAQSAMRQWLNSDAAAGSVWSPTNKFDRNPSWAAGYSGFMLGLPADFLEVVQAADIPCCTNTRCETQSLDGTEFTTDEVYGLKDKFFLLSRPEIYGTWDSTAYQDGELLEYYEGLTAAECTKYDEGGTARVAWLRSPSRNTANNPRAVNSTTGGIYARPAAYGLGVAPACIIA